MAELALLSALSAHLSAAGLLPEPASIGVSEPEDAVALPALVLSLDGVDVARSVGERSSSMRGALAWQVKVSLSNPTLPEDPSVVLLDATRRRLILPHGGLVQQGGTSGPLSAADLAVRVDGVERPVVIGVPVGDQVAADPVEGVLVFGTALPASGTVSIRYFIGQWERRLRFVSGTLRLDACAATAEAVIQLGESALEALGAFGDGNAKPPGVTSLSLTSLTSVAANEGIPGGLRRRTARLAFHFEHTVDTPESSGGIIRRIQIDTRFSSGAGEIHVS